MTPLHAGDRIRLIRSYGMPADDEPLTVDEVIEHHGQLWEGWAHRGDERVLLLSIDHWEVVA